MIRQDYIMRQVAELIQTLARAVSLRHRREYARALSEINAALHGLRGPQTPAAPEPSVEEWIKLCRKHEHMASGLMVAVAELLKEQGDLFALEERHEPARRSWLLALGLLLEGLLGGETFVSAPLLAKVDHLVEETANQPRPVETTLRLGRYFEARGMFAKAEDVLFAASKAGDTQAQAACGELYERLLALGDSELERGGLPRLEIEEGRRQLGMLRRA